MGRGFESKDTKIDQNFLQSFPLPFCRNLQQTLSLTKFSKLWKEVIAFQ